MRWWALAQTASVCESKHSLLSIIVPRYLYYSPESTGCPSMIVGGRGGRCFLKSRINSIVLETFMFKKERLQQSLKSFTTGPWSIPLSLRRDTMTESSANLKTCLPSYCDRHSFVYKTKRRGERTHPRGEPAEDKRLPDKTPLILTLWDLEVKK